MPFSIPIIDLSNGNFEQVTLELTNAFKTVGFVYVINHGLSQAKIDETFEAAGRFFSLPAEVKRSGARPGTNEDGHSNNNGWVEVGTEALNPERPADLKEAFNFTPAHPPVWPDHESIGGFRSQVEQLYTDLGRLASRLLAHLAAGLQLQPDFFAACHGGAALGRGPGNPTTLRCLHYPKADGVRAGQLRCGEHSDYGSITLLLQDSAGGLQVRGSSGEYVDATPIEGAVVVNLGDMMQQWTADVLKATKHRVIVPEEEVRRRLPRQSLAFFVHPDDDTLITCLDGSGKYPDVTAGEWLEGRFKATY